MANKKENPKVLLGRRVRQLRNKKGWTQQELGSQANVNYKFLGEIERGQQNPSFEVLAKISAALNVDLTELFRFEQEILNQKELINQINEIVKSMPADDLRQLLMILRTLFPIR